MVELLVESGTHGSASVLGRVAADDRGGDWRIARRGIPRLHPAWYELRGVGRKDGRLPTEKRLALRHGTASKS